MNSLFDLFPSFGLFLTLGVYTIAMWINKKLKTPIANPLLIAVILIIAILVVGKVNVPVYQESASFVSYLLTPATIA